HIHRSTRYKCRLSPELCAFSHSEIRVYLFQMPAAVMARHTLCLNAKELRCNAVGQCIIGVLNRISLLKGAHDEIRGSNLMRIALGGDHLRSNIFIRAVPGDEIA